MAGKSVVKVASAGGNPDVIERFTAELLDRGKAKGTARMYSYELRRLREWLQQSHGSLERMTRFDVQQYINAMRDGKILRNGKKASVATVDRIYGTIASFAKYIHKLNIVADIRRPKKQSVSKIPPQALSRNEKNRVFREVERDGDLRNIAIVYLFLYCGLRVAELVSLDRENVDVKRGGMVKVVGKENKERHVPFPAEARRAVQAYLNSRTDQLTPLFLSNMKRRMSIRSVERVIGKYGHHPHELRHTFLKNALDETDSSGKKIFTIVEVAQMAGHNSIETTMRYTLSTQEEINNKMNSLHEN